VADNDARAHLMSKLVHKAWEDEAFKKELLANPRAAFEKETGVKIPANVEVQALEESAEKLYIVIPMQPGASRKHRLTDEELDAVAGGVSWGCGEVGP
jgi:hypothetical protein